MTSTPSNRIPILSALPRALPNLILAVFAMMLATLLLIYAFLENIGVITR